MSPWDLVRLRTIAVGFLIGFISVFFGTANSLEGLLSDFLFCAIKIASTYRYNIQSTHLFFSEPRIA
jgi:hypothetical protein